MQQMAVAYVNVEEIWKCPKHPSKRHCSGICPTCLRDRLSSLCPDCATVRPCTCSAVTTSSSSSSSSFSRFSFSGREKFGAGIGSVGRVSNSIESELAFRRSRSVAVQSVGAKSKLVEVGREVNKNESRSRKTTTASFWWWLRRRKREGEVVEVEEAERRSVMMRKSRSVATTTSDYGKSKGGKWYFPSPMKAFMQTRLSKFVARQRSPIIRINKTKMN